MAAISRIQRQGANQIPSVQSEFMLKSHGNFHRISAGGHYHTLQAQPEHSQVPSQFAQSVAPPSVNRLYSNELAARSAIAGHSPTQPTRIPNVKYVEMMKLQNNIQKVTTASNENLKKPKLKIFSEDRLAVKK
jgi:hypothetical protein